MAISYCAFFNCPQGVISKRLNEYSLAFRLAKGEIEAIKSSFEDLLLLISVRGARALSSFWKEITFWNANLCLLVFD